MKYRGMLIRFIVLFSITILVACTQNVTSNLESTQMIAGETIWKALTNGSIGSAQVTVMDDGEIVFNNGYGPADRKTGMLVDEETVFNIGSISKMFITVSILMLQDDGLLNLEDSVVEHIPEFIMADSRYTDITIRML
jgi:CubicO group peptidase (beta-lactamase class C family)